MICDIISVVIKDHYFNPNKISNQIGLDSDEKTGIRLNLPEATLGMQNSKYF